MQPYQDLIWKKVQISLTSLNHPHTRHFQPKIITPFCFSCFSYGLIFSMLLSSNYSQREARGTVHLCLTGHNTRSLASLWICPQVTANQVGNRNILYIPWLSSLPLFFFFWLGIKPIPPTLGAWSLTPWTTREIPSPHL